MHLLYCQVARTAPDDGAGWSGHRNADRPDQLRRPWSSSFSIGGTAGVLASAPAADVFRNGTEVDVFYRRPDSSLGESVYTDANGWSPSFSIGGTAGVLASAPATDVFRNGTEVDVYWQSANSALRESVYSDAGAGPGR
jgi:hypothetical protein